MFYLFLLTSPTFTQQFGRRFSEKAKQFKSRKAAQVNAADHPVLYVGQREFATITSSDNVSIFLFF